MLGTATSSYGCAVERSETFLAAAKLLGEGHMRKAGVVCNLRHCLVGQ
jgi:hypothetical protein